jgi:16S rRNA (guanine966-N2)-methyltransferase
VLDVPRVEGLRPTPERVRETLFNWLSPRIEGAACLDLFAGTGALGLEALSRGAARAVFVERSPEAVRMLERNAMLLDAEGAELRPGDAYAMLMRPWEEVFDIVFLDPPFVDDRTAELCRLVQKAGLLAPGGVIYLEEARERAPATLPEGWVVSKQKTAGNVRFSLVKPAA